jgi:aryl-alcohol dehydrogenase-like predicted oxidoreductase
MRAIGGLEVSEVGLGCNNFGKRVDLGDARAVIDAALGAGVNFLDTADIYGTEKGASETMIGEALKGRRDRVVLATKFGMDMRGLNGDAPRGSPAYIERAVEGSLRRLQTDTIDLYQYHEPDGVTPIEETIAALHDLVRDGKVRFIGCSNFEQEHLDHAGDAFVSLQNEYSLLERGLESLEIPDGVAVLPYFPLASGLLTGKYRRGEGAPEGTRMHGRDQVADDATFDRLDRLASFARERGIEPIDVAIGWLLARPRIASVIAGARSPEQVERNVRAAEWKPNDGDLADLDRIFPPPGS